MKTLWEVSPVFSIQIFVRLQIAWGHRYWCHSLKSVEALPLAPTGMASGILYQQIWITKRHLHQLLLKTAPYYHCYVLQHGPEHQRHFVRSCNGGGVTVVTRDSNPEQVSPRCRLPRHTSHRQQLDGLQHSDLSVHPQPVRPGALFQTRCPQRVLSYALPHAGPQRGTGALATATRAWVPRRRVACGQVRGAGCGAVARWVAQTQTFCPQGLGSTRRTPGHHLYPTNVVP